MIIAIGNRIGRKSSSPSWTPQNIGIVQTQTGFIVSWTLKDANSETEVWINVDGGSYVLITTVGLGVTSYAYTCDDGHVYGVKLRSKLDQTALNIPTLTTSEITGGVRISGNVNNTEAEYIEIYASIAGSGFSLLTTITVSGSTYTYDHILGGDITAIYKARAKEGTLPVYSEYSSASTIITSITDIDGNVYTKVVIGVQEWMVEALKTTKYRDGTAVTNVTDNTLWNGLTSEAYCWYNNDSVSYKATYGALYNWYAAINAHGLAPSGWRVPTTEDYTRLTTFVGGEAAGAGHLKEAGTDHWQTPNTGADNSSGFKALGGGQRYGGNFNQLNQTCGLWTQSTDGTYGRYRTLVYNSAGVSNGVDYKVSGKFIRCIKVYPTTAEIDAHLSFMNTYYSAHAPTENQTFLFNTTDFGIPTGGATNTDIVAIKAAFVSAGYTATFTLNS